MHANSRLYCISLYCISIISILVRLFGLTSSSVGGEGYRLAHHLARVAVRQALGTPQGEGVIATTGDGCARCNAQWRPKLHSLLKREFRATVRRLPSTSDWWVEADGFEATVHSPAVPRPREPIGQGRWARDAETLGNPRRATMSGRPAPRFQATALAAAAARCSLRHAAHARAP